MSETEEPGTRARILRACCSIVGATYGKPGAPMCYSSNTPRLPGADLRGERPTLIYFSGSLHDSDRRREWAALNPPALKMGNLTGNIAAEDCAAWELETAIVAEKALRGHVATLRGEYAARAYTDTGDGAARALDALRFSHNDISRGLE